MIAPTKTAGASGSALQLAPEPVDEPSHGPAGIREINLLVLLVGFVSVAVAFPFPAVKFGIIIAFAVIFVLQTIRHPAMGLALLTFGVPALDLVPHTLIPIRGVNAELILAFALLFVWRRATQIYGRDKLNSKIGVMLGIYAMMIVLSCFHSWMVWKVSLFDLLAASKNHMTCMLFFPVAFHTLRNRRDQLLLVGAASLSILLNCLQAIDHSWFALVTGTLERRRAQALMALQPNLLGATLDLYLPVFMMLCFHVVESKAARFFFLICTGAAAFALLLTLSRGAWIGLLLGLVFMALYRSRKLLIILVVLGATMQFWVPQQVWDRIGGTTDVEALEDVDPGQVADGSTQMRIEQYKSLPGMMAPRPVFGWGYLSFSRVFEKYGTLGRKKGAHSSYCLIGTEEGAVGLLVLAGLFCAMFWGAFRASQVVEDPFLRWMAVGVAAGVLGMIVCMASGSRFDAQKVFAFFWVWLAIVERERLVVEARATSAHDASLGPMG